ncbi:MAG: chromosome segregation protein SMC [Oscillospiraceae bacterium]|nr:chromosome segregation protein SMC [Oscillospiraceae bacterium]
MYLKALEIQGFKSFPDKTVLSFEEDMTAIVGPNGSGKSNISDAIRWVMGEQSTKTLRGAKMEDVIFDGTQKRKSLGFAEVSLVLDNAAHLFPLEDSEVMVTRRYYRSGESEYYINRRGVRLKDVNELFMDTGLGREGYAMIGQGKIDEILSVKSADRREIFEEAAGISRFRHRKEEAERKLQRTEENLVRVNDKIEELSLQVEPLRVQAEKARKFLLLRDELRGLEVSVWMEQLDKLRAASIKVNADYETAARQKDEMQGQVETLYAAAESCAERMREKDIQSDALREEAARMESAAGECETTLSVLQNNIENNQKNVQRIQGELEAQQGRAGSIAGQIDQRRARLDSLTDQTQALREEMERRQAQAEGVDRSAGTLNRELEQLRQRVEAETASAAEARALLSALGAAAQEVLDREQAVGRELIDLQERRKQAGEQLEQVSLELEQARQERDDLGNIISGYQMRLDARKKKADSAEQQQINLKMQENNLASRIHMLSEMEKMYEGYSKAVKVVMAQAGRGVLKGIHGPVAGLLHVPDRYAVAIETALGGAMQHIVVESDESGKAAIEYLKRRDAGRATFLPVPSMRPSEFRDMKAAEEPGILGIADQLIQFDRRYQRVFSNLLGRVVIAENLNRAVAVARKYGRRFKIVTLDGQVLNVGGSMTGGSASKSAGILSRANELERLNRQRQALQEDLAQAARTLEEARREQTAAAYEMETAQAQRREQESRALTLQERLNACQEQVSGLENRRQALEEEAGQLKQRSRSAEEDAGRAKARIEELEGAAAALQAQAEGKEKGQKDLRERLAAMQQEQAAAAARLSALEEELAASEKSLEELAQLRRDIEGDRQARAGMIAQFQQSSQELEDQIAQKQGEFDSLRAESRTKAEEIRRLNQERLELEAQRNRAERDSREKNAQLLSMEREVSALEQKKLSASLEEKQLLDKLWDTYELSHEAARQQRQALESLPKAQRRIGELKRAISALGNINLDAIEEFQRVNERYTYLTDQRDDVGKSKEELEGIISKLTEEMRTIFAQQFQCIQQAFSQTFQDLFGGGRAALELEDPEDILNCGIEIKAQPPGKALKTISLLSSGERAFVAIALYFAILKVRPTPFCVMDEIEAALDDANVVRFARYMRRMSGKTQFIVITHRRGTMEEADVLYGVTMQEQGVSRILTINLNDVEKELNIR